MLLQKIIQIFCFFFVFGDHTNNGLENFVFSDEAVKKLHDCIEKVAVTLGQDSTDVFRALLAKLIEQPEEKQTFDRLLEMAEKLAAKH